MNRKIQDILDKSNSVSELESFWGVMTGELERLGASGVLYGRLVSRNEYRTRDATRRFFWKTNYCSQYFDAFGDMHFADTDPTVEHVVNGNGVLQWHKEDEWDDVTEEEYRRFRLEDELGFGIGVTVPSSYYSKFNVGGVGVAMNSIARSDFDAYWSSHGQEIVTIIGLLDSGMREEHLEEFIKLSPREKECLTWLAVGLTPDQISERLNRQPKTIEKHIASAKKRMRVNTRDHAVARALQMKLINP